jgi:hypothetical protein
MFDISGLNFPDVPFYNEIARRLNIDFAPISVQFREIYTQSATIILNVGIEKILAASFEITYPNGDSYSTTLFTISKGINDEQFELSVPPSTKIKMDTYSQIKNTFKFEEAIKNLLIT